MVKRLKGKNIFIFIGSGLIAGYFVNAALHPETWHFIDNVNLVIHEAGHWLVFPFGEFMQVAGGTLIQVLLPLVFCLYFFLRRQYLSGSLVSFWLGESIINVSVYAKDALLMRLPLLGGDGTIHDWNFMLSSLNLLRYTSIIGSAIWFLGIAIFFAAGALVLWSIFWRNDIT